MKVTALVLPFLLRRQILWVSQPMLVACDADTSGAWPSRLLSSCIPSVQPLGCCNRFSNFCGSGSFSAWIGSDRVCVVLKEDDWRWGDSRFGGPKSCVGFGSLSLWWRRLGSRPSDVVAGFKDGLDPCLPAVCRCWGCKQVTTDRPRLRRHRFVHRTRQQQRRKQRPWFLGTGSSPVLVILD